MKFFQVNQIKSKRAVEREGLEVTNTEKHIGNFGTKEDALSAYELVPTGMEIEKQLLFIDEESNICQEIETTF